MDALRRIVLVRHGETEGESSIRLHGTADLSLDTVGREQMRRLAGKLGHQRFDRIVASPLRRAWQSAWIVAGGRPVALDPDFREVDFGHWEGLTVEEVEKSDPVLYEEWKSGSEEFAYPSGESRKELRERVQRGLERLLASGGRAALLVIHKGVSRVIVETLTGEAPDPEEPRIGEALILTRVGDGWIRGERSSNPKDLAELNAPQGL